MTITDPKGDERKPAPEQAAEWYLRFEESPNVDSAEQARFFEWLRRSPTHAEELRNVGVIRRKVADLPPGLLPTVEQLIEAAREDAVRPEPEIMPVGRATTGSRRFWPWYAAVAGVAVVALSIHVLVAAGRTSFETAVGEQRSVLLSDGSVVEMNTATRIEVAYTHAERLVELQDGEAVFDVQYDPERPLRVLATPAEVVAMGTRFNVYRHEDQTVVTVVDGLVSVARMETSSQDRGPGSSRGEAVEVGQGHQVTVSALGPVALPTAVDVLATTAWRDRRLIFNGTPLGKALEEINRYNSRKLELDDDKLAAKRISGVFAAHQPETMVVFLQTVGDFHFDETSRGWTIRSTPPGSPGELSASDDG